MRENESLLAAPEFQVYGPYNPFLGFEVISVQGAFGLKAFAVTRIRIQEEIGV